MQPEDLANAFATFADKVDMMSEVVDRFNAKLAEFGDSKTAAEEPATEGQPETLSAVGEQPAVPPTPQVEEVVSDMPNSVLSLVEALNTWKGE